MKVDISYHQNPVSLDIPDEAVIYKSSYGEPAVSAESTVMDAVNSPIGSLPLADSIMNRRGGDVVLAVSDITRPIPYRKFLPPLLRKIESSGVRRGDITILIATGMHRPCTPDEHLYMFGEEIVRQYRIVNHDADGDLAVLEGTSFSGNPVSVNRIFAEAGYKITIGLVEPHFMAGFSGGRKTVCPGLSSLETIKNFHGYKFLSDPDLGAAKLKGNPCHEESLSIALIAGVDFSINIVLNSSRQLVKAFAGDMSRSHEQACLYVGEHACPDVRVPADVVITGCGGYPLDATFYQCTKALVTALPCVKKSGKIIAAGSCIEGIGSETYRDMLFRYSGNFSRFLDHIKNSGSVIKDQWQIQMQARVDFLIGRENVSFYTHGVAHADGGSLGVTAICCGRDEIAVRMQSEIDSLARQGLSFAVIPEGPYCTPE